MNKVPNGAELEGSRSVTIHVREVKYTPVSQILIADRTFTRQAIPHASEARRVFKSYHKSSKSFAHTLRDETVPLVQPTLRVPLSRRRIFPDQGGTA